MKTTLETINTAYIALNRIRNKIRGKDALALFHLKRQLQEKVDFTAEEEQKLVEEFDGAITQTGMVIIADPEKREAFGKAHAELFKMECEIEPDVAVINLERNPDITMEDIEQLDGFAAFE